MDYKKFKLIKELPDRFHLMHPNGEDFQIAKRGLDALSLQKISKLQIQHLDEGGPVADPTAGIPSNPNDVTLEGQSEPVPQPSQAQQDFNANLAGRQFQQANPIDPDTGLPMPIALPQGDDQTATLQALKDTDTQADQRSNDAKAAEDDAMAKAAAAKGAADQAAALKAKLGIDAAGTPAAPAMATIAPEKQIPVPAQRAQASSASGPGAITPSLSGAFSQAERSALQEAAAKQSEGNLKMDAARKEAAAQQAAFDAGQERLNSLRTQNAALYDEFTNPNNPKYKNNQINPNRYWDNKSAPNKISTIFSMILGGFAAPTTGGRNLAMDAVNNEINQDIEAQKANINNKQSLYAKNLEQFKNEDEATMAARAQLTTIAAAQANQAAAQAIGPAAKAAADKVRLDLLTQSANLDISLAKFRAQQAYYGGSATAGTNLGLIDEKDRANAVRLPNGIVRPAWSPEAAVKARESIENVAPIINQLDALDAIGPAALIPNSPENQKAQAIRATLIPLINQNQEIKRLGGEVMSNLDQQVRDPSKFAQLLGGKARTDVVRNFVTDKMGAILNQQLMGGYQAPAAAQAKAKPRPFGK